MNKSRLPTRLFDVRVLQEWLIIYTHRPAYRASLQNIQCTVNDDNTHNDVYNFISHVKVEKEADNIILPTLPDVAGRGLVTVVKLRIQAAVTGPAPFLSW